MVYKVILFSFMNEVSDFDEFISISVAILIAWIVIFM
jgi:hypothetical protein